MEDGVYYIGCDRPGCNCIVGAQRYENNAVVEEEWVLGMVITEEGNTYCEACNLNRETFRELEELAEVLYENCCD